MTDIPHDWDPRRYQRSAWKYLQEGGKRASLVWHRRAGKDSFALNWTASAAMKRVGTYWHMLPAANQGKKVIWEGIDKAGRRVIDQAFPKWARDSKSPTNATEMSIRLATGSLIQVCGSDNYNSLVGSNPIGVVFSEYSLADKRAWDFIRPILAENGGWAIFIFTPRGQNHAYELHEMAKRNSAWFAQTLTVADTGAIPMEMIEEERQAGMPEALIQQEFFCSFESAIHGAYYGTLIRDAKDAGRVGKVQGDPILPVHTAWDLGVGDSTAIWFYQVAGREIRIIDYYEQSGEGLPHYAGVLKDRGYVYGVHHAPHDIQVRELGSGRSRLETAASLGITFQVVKNQPIEDGIEAVRSLLPMCWFDETRCKPGLAALEHYRKDWNDKYKVFRSGPVHDWASHGADAFRYLAIGFEWGGSAVRAPKRKARNWMEM